MFRSILAVALGFILMMILAMTYGRFMFSLYPEAQPVLAEDGTLSAGTMSLVFIFVLLALDFANAAFGGYFTAATAGRNERKHANALAILVLILGLLNLVSFLEVVPVAYAVARTFCAPIGVWVGGLLWGSQKATTQRVQEPSK